MAPSRGAAGAGSGPAQHPPVPVLVPAVTDSRDQPSEATEVLTTTLLTIEQESECAATAGPAQHPCPEHPHSISRGSPCIPGLTPCSQGAQPMPCKGSTHIFRDHPMLTVFTLGCLGVTPCPQGHLAFPGLPLGAHPMLPKGSPHISRAPSISPWVAYNSP